jgi:hypothetical protein
MWSRAVFKKTHTVVYQHKNRVNQRDTLRILWMPWGYLLGYITIIQYDIDKKQIFRVVIPSISHFSMFCPRCTIANTGKRSTLTLSSFVPTTDKTMKKSSTTLTVGHLQYHQRTSISPTTTETRPLTDTFIDEWMYIWWNCETSIFLFHNNSSRFYHIVPSFSLALLCSSPPSPHAGEAVQPMQISLQRGPDDDGPTAPHDQLLERGVVTDRLRPILGARF